MIGWPGRSIPGQIVSLWKSNRMKILRIKVIIKAIQNHFPLLY